MTTIDHATTGLCATTRPTVMARVTTAAIGFFRAWKHRSQFDRLGEMSDAELADVGLTRSDLRVASDLPFGLDRTAHLNAIVRNRVDACAASGCAD